MRPPLWYRDSWCKTDAGGGGIGDHLYGDFQQEQAFLPPFYFSSRKQLFYIRIDLPIWSLTAVMASFHTTNGGHRAWSIILIEKSVFEISKVKDELLNKQI